MLLTSYPSPLPMLTRPGDHPATLAVEDRGLWATLANANDPSCALDIIMADTYGRTFDQPSN